MRLVDDIERSGIGMTSRRTRERLIARLYAAGICDPDVLDVLGSVPRHLFIEEALASRAYEDSALPIGHGQTISQPYTVARMTAALLASDRPDRVLEVGTGSGYQTAVLASLARRVYSVERIGALADEAARRLRRLAYRNVRLRHGDGGLGWPEYAPFECIMVTAAAADIPYTLLDQLAPGGRMVLPIVDADHQVLTRVTRTHTGYSSEVLEEAVFVPLLGGVA